MNRLQRLAPFWLLLVLCLAGCGGSGSSANSAVKDPFNPAAGSSNQATTDTGAVLAHTMTLSTTDSTGTCTSVGPNSTVIATATLKDSAGNPVANQLVTFASDPASPLPINSVSTATDSNGRALVFLKAPDTTSSTDVILVATTTVNSQPVSAISIFKVLHGTGNIINFITTKVPTDPDGTLNSLDVVVEGVTATGTRILLQQVPFEILDLNNNPRSRIPVTISIYSHIGCPDVFINSSPSELPATVTTDDTGRGIFNVGVPLDIPPIGDKNACSVIYKAVGPDVTNPSSTIFSYGGFIASITNKESTPTPTPTPTP